MSKTNSDINQRAVDNFLGTLHGMSQLEALANLELDSKLYRWNTATSRAIQAGIMAARLDWKR
jgi:hypothetical protein